MGIIPYEQTHVFIDFGDFYPYKLWQMVYIPLVTRTLYCDG